MESLAIGLRVAFDTPEGLKTSSVRVNDNVLRVINAILGNGSPRRGTVRWSPPVAVLTLEKVARSMEQIF